MKLAYIAYDATSLKTQNILSKNFGEIEYFFVQPNSRRTDAVFEEWPILTDSLCIPAEKLFQTKQHELALGQVRSQYEKLKSELLGPAMGLKQITKDPGASAIMTSPFNEIKDIFFDSSKQKVIIEKGTLGTSEYDFLIVENHQLIASEIKHIKSQLFSIQPAHSHVWYSIGFTYQLKKNRVGFLPDRKFFFVKDRKNCALVDNWYGCHFEKSGQVIVQQWVPFNQYQNLDYKRFMIERTRAAIETEFDFLTSLEYSNSYVESTAGYCTQRGRAKKSKLSAVVPPVCFWSQLQIDSVFTQLMEPKIKKLEKIHMHRAMT